MPVVAPAGTITVKVFPSPSTVGVALTTVPLNLITLLAAILLKLAPSIITVLPTILPEGVNLVIVGVGTLKSLSEVAVDGPPVTSTVILPDVVPASQRASRSALVPEYNATQTAGVD